MIAVSAADIGRRVTYDPRPVIPHQSHGRIVGLRDGDPMVLFDWAEAPLCVISNLKWLEKRA